jgi:hypothetical protein
VPHRDATAEVPLGCRALRGCPEAVCAKLSESGCRADAQPSDTWHIRRPREPSWLADRFLGGGTFIAGPAMLVPRASRSRRSGSAGGLQKCGDLNESPALYRTPFLQRIMSSTTIPSPWRGTATPKIDAAITAPQ